jgi:hypothetical protein
MDNWRVVISTAGEARTRAHIQDTQQVTNEAAGQKDQPECEVIFARSFSLAEAIALTIDTAGAGWSDSV